MPEKAVEFHKQSGVNCAMAVLKGFEDRLDICECKITLSKSWGGGNAPDGTCGALHAACELLDDKKVEELQQEFIDKAGSTTCRDIRSINKLSCSECVKLAAEKVAEN